MSKRVIDIAVSLLGLLALLPVLVLVALLIRWQLGAPVLFKQPRPGLHGRPFNMIKFRSMLNAFDQQGQLLPNQQRLTRFGQWLRSTSLDELPELWNVLRGDMSLVGPRPLLMDYLPLYNERQQQRHLCKPGITGWAQVNGRNAISWEEKFEYDIWYVNHQTIWLDIKIMFLTLKKVFIREGIAHADHVAMPRFEGNSK